MDFDFSPDANHKVNMIFFQHSKPVLFSMTKPIAAVKEDRKGYSVTALTINDM